MNASSKPSLPASMVNEYASAAFVEDEIKLDAPNKAYLDIVWSYVLQEGEHYVKSNNNHTTAERPDNVDWDQEAADSPDPYQATTKFRYRYYFDTRLMSLFNAKAEVRLEPSGQEYKQVIKIGNGATEDSPMMGRAEHPARVSDFEPSLTAIKDTGSCRDKTIAKLNTAVEGQGEIKPLVAIRSQRRKMEYHPGGDRNVTIEMAFDIGVMKNVADSTWQIRQIELEIKANKTDIPNSQILQEEISQLKGMFAKLEVNTESKPTPAFEDLMARELTEKKFGKVSSEQFSVLKKTPKLKAV